MQDGYVISYDQLGHHRGREGEWFFKARFREVDDRQLVTCSNDTFVEDMITKGRTYLVAPYRGAGDRGCLVSVDQLAGYDPKNTELDHRGRESIFFYVWNFEEVCRPKLTEPDEVAWVRMKKDARLGNTVDFGARPGKVYHVDRNQLRNRSDDCTMFSISSDQLEMSRLVSPGARYAFFFIQDFEEVDYRTCVDDQGGAAPGRLTAGKSYVVEPSETSTPGSDFIETSWSSWGSTRPWWSRS
jgi:hypothetical protein